MLSCLQVLLQRDSETVRDRLGVVEGVNKALHVLLAQSNDRMLFLSDWPVSPKWQLRPRNVHRWTIFHIHECFIPSAINLALAIDLSRRACKVQVNRE